MTAQAAIDLLTELAEHIEGHVAFVLVDLEDRSVSWGGHDPNNCIDCAHLAHQRHLADLRAQPLEPVRGQSWEARRQAVRRARAGR